jgi:amidase
MAGGMSEDEKADNREINSTQSNRASVPSKVAHFSIQEHGEWAFHNNERHLLRKTWGQFFEEWDILLCPQMPTTAFPYDHGEYFGRTISIDNEEQEYLQQVYWAGLITVAHLPSTVFPTGPSKEGLPIGIQAAGAEFQDYTTIEFSRLMAQEFGGFIAPPKYS